MRRVFRLIVAVLAAAAGMCLAAGSASAHEPGTSAVLLDIDASNVVAELQLPLDRLELAVDLPLAEQPDQVVDTYGETLAIYVSNHIGADGAPWTVELGSLTVRSIDGVDHLVATATLIPPGGVVTDFTLTYDVILDRVLSHEIVVAAGPAGGERTVVGTFNHVTNRIDVEHAATSGSFRSMVTLGFEHVLDGADHLLFLVVLLLPAPLLSTTGRRWDRAGKPLAALVSVVQVATAFTIGHSMTLAASALGWISAPSMRYDRSSATARLSSQEVSDSSTVLRSTGSSTTTDSTPPRPRRRYSGSTSGSNWRSF